MTLWTDTDWTRLARYLAGSATGDERAAVEAWLRERPERRQAFADLDHAWRGIQPRSAASTTDTSRAMAWNALRARIDADQAPPRGGGRRTRTRTRGSWGWWRGALAGVGIAGTVLVGVTQLDWSAVRTSRPAAERTYTTRTAQQLRVELPDGSRVTLAPQSTMRYGTDATGARTVTLDGQAFFMITHDPAHPFTVRTGAITTRVIGTNFDVQAYAHDRAVRVAVTSGKVVAANAYRSLVLSADAVGELTDSTAVATPHGAEDAAAWAAGQLVFTRTPVRAMLEVAGRWCGYEFRLADTTLARRHVTTVLLVNDPRTTMKMLEELLDVTITVDQGVATLRPRGTAERAGEGQKRAPVRRDPQVAFPSSSEVGK